MKKKLKEWILMGITCMMLTFAGSAFCDVAANCTNLGNCPDICWAGSFCSGTCSDPHSVCNIDYGKHYYTIDGGTCGISQCNQYICADFCFVAE